MTELAVAEVMAAEPSPPELATVANREHALARQSGESMIEHAIHAGEALVAAKAQVKHGEWLPWLAANFAASEDTAEGYMKVAANSERVRNLEEPSLRKALAAVSSEDKQAVHYSSETDEWETPQELFDLLDREFKFALDVCALDSSAKCPNYFTPQDDGLGQEWTGTCWMNPPYGSAIGRWVEKAFVSAEAGATVVCLVPARVDTAWWWDWCRFGEIRFLRGRLKFGASGTSAPFPSAVVVFPRQPKVIWWDG